MQITTFRMIYLTVANEYDPWPGATTFSTFQLPELIADTLTAGPSHIGAVGAHPRPRIVAARADTLGASASATSAGEGEVRV